jgi:hypothetical protein
MKRIVFILGALLILCSCGERVSYREIEEAEQTLAQYNGYVVKAKSTFKENGKYECILYIANDTSRIGIGPIPKKIFDKYNLDDTIKEYIKDEIQEFESEDVESDIIETQSVKETITENPVKFDNKPEQNIKTNSTEIINVNGIDILIIEKDGKKEAIKLN